MAQRIPLKNWYSSLISNINIAATEMIFSNFDNIKFVVIAQKRTKNKIKRRIAFLVGPYIICEAVNELNINKFVEDWLSKSPNVPLGKMIKMADQKRTLVKKGKNYRKFKLTGQVESSIKESFFGVDKLTVGAFCGTVFNSPEDVSNALKFGSVDKYDVTLFPESYPFSRMEPDFSGFKKNSILGYYSKSGPKMFFLLNKPVLINKSTFFANEKILSKKKFLPNVFEVNGKKIAVLVCYDVMNPKISFSLGKKEVDAIFVSAMIPAVDIERWKRFVYVRGNESQCPIVVVSAKDKRNITAPFVIYYDPISDSVSVNTTSQKIDLFTGKRLLESPKIHWSWLLKNGAFGPFLRDF